MKIKVREELYKGNNLIYVITAIISLICIGCSFIPYGIEQGEAILQGLGCSGIAAALMAYFIDKSERQKQDKKRNEYRQFLLADLNHELKQFIERTIWFDMAIKKLDLDKELPYYFSLDFLQEAHKLDLYRVMDWGEVEETVESIMKYYNHFEWLSADDERLSFKVPYMFKIISSASKRIQLQIDKLYEDRVYLIANSILDEEEILSIYHALNHQVDFLECRNTNYATPVSFLVATYKCVREMGNYSDKFYIAWQPGKELGEMYLEKKMRNDIFF